MYIPDLFGAYVKGRELAISKNWDDLKNYESVEAARNQNDLSAMDIWERRQQMPGKMSMFYDNVNSSTRANEVAEAGQRGMLAKAHLGSDVAVGDYSIYKQHEQDYLNTKSGMFGARIGQQANAVQNLLGQNAYLAPIANELGVRQAQTGANQIYANGVVGDNLVNKAKQDVALSNQAYGNNYKGGQLQGMQYDSQIAQHPLVHKNAMYGLKNVIPDDEARREGTGNPPQVSQAEISELWGLATREDPTAIHRLEALGLIERGTFAKKFGAGLGMTQDLMGAGGQTQTGPVATTPNTAPQAVNVNGKTIMTHPSGVVVTPDGKTNFMMTPAEAQRRVAAASLVPSAYDQNLWSNYHKVAGYSGP